jgi:ferredoxin
MLHVAVDRARCQGAGECVHIAPASFRIDETVTAAALEPPDDEETTLIEAARSCPNSAIQLFRDGIEIDAFASEGSSNG